MRDPDERAASLALRNGGPASVRRAIGWYRTHDRLHCGDQITMAADALAAYRADTAAGKDALLICDTTEMADALNQRLHHDTIAADAPTVTGARGHRIAVGDLIITRRNDATIPLRNTDDPAAEHDARCATGNAGASLGINPDNNRLIARRLDDNTLGAFFERLRPRAHHPTATPSPCTPPKASPPTPPTPCSARTPPARCSTSP